MRLRRDTEGHPLARMLREQDWVVVGICALLITVAIINLNSAGAEPWADRVRTQVSWIVLGTCVLFGVSAIDYRMIYRGAYAAYGVGVTLLVAVALVGRTVKGAGRWLEIGPARLQPSELMKVLLIIAVARFLHGLSAAGTRTWRHYAIFAAMVLGPTFLVLRQPDLSTSIMLLLITFTLLCVAELRLRGIVGLLVGALLAVALGYRFMEDYQSERVEVWLDPEAYADDEGYQTIQSMISVGNGGFFGRGVHGGTQNVLGYLPERYTDFPFAVFAEEWGFAGGTVVLLLYAALVLWAINLGSMSRDRFAALVCVGVGALFFWHVVINVGMVLQLLPVTGVTLPFFSVGGSNVLTLMLSLGVLSSISRARRRRIQV